jgi:hypothetical protein
VPVILKYAIIFLIISLVTGALGLPPAICAAIEDALRPLGVKIDALPVTPAKLRALIRVREPS